MTRVLLHPPSRIIAANGSLLAGLALPVLLLGPACRGEAPPSEASGRRPETVATPASVSETEEADTRPILLFVGTSLTAAYGLDPSEGYPARIQEKIDAAGLAYRVVAAGVSGETSAGALRRMDWLLRQPIAVLVLETGANDGLRGQPPEATRANIQGIFDRARMQDPPPRLALVAMEALPNYGQEYRQEFRAIYPELAEANDALLVPFLLDGVAGVPELNLPDGIHPTAEGQRIVAENIWRALEPLLDPSPL